MSEAAEKIAGEIRKKGAITFARFMDLALYCPNCGYYETEKDTIGSQGDFYTSVSAGTLFGELLAFQFSEWLEQSQLSSTRPGVSNAGIEGIRIMEAGAHRGRLARDILSWILRHRPALFERLHYWIVERSDRQRAWQQESLAEFGNKVRWARGLAELKDTATFPKRHPNSAAVKGVIFSNEMLDAIPVHRLGWDAKARVWFEWGVTLRAGRFVWTRLACEGLVDQPSSSSAAVLVPPFRVPIEDALLEMLPDGFSIEVCPAAEQWWREAANALESGKLLAIDYGLTVDELFIPERQEGTLRAYHRHHPSRDILANPGEQDITAHVNFTAIREVGEAAGLKTSAFLTQAQFLTDIAARAWQNEGAFGEWTPQRAHQFQTLTHPEHLGRSFRVLLQSRT